jgi:ribose transport system permease protein
MKAVLRSNHAVAGVAGLIALLLVIGLVFSEQFRSANNLLNVLEQAAPLSFVALGQTLVILTGGIDLSFASQIALISSLTSGLIDGHPERVIPVVCGALMLGAAIGLANGALILWLRVHPLIVTLGMAATLQGLVLLYTVVPVGSIPPDYDFLAYGRLGGLPVGIILAILCYVVVGCILRYTRLGRDIYAYGGDAHAATMVGLPVSRVVLITYALAGLCAAATAIFLVSRLGVGDPVADQNINLTSITPVVVGGTLLSGGRGGVLGTFLGVLMVQLLNNLLNFLDVSTFYQWMVQGVIVIVAVSLYVERKRAYA